MGEDISKWHIQRASIQNICPIYTKKTNNSIEKLAENMNIYMCVCVCVMDYYLAVKKNEILLFAETWI